MTHNFGKVFEITTDSQFMSVLNLIKDELCAGSFALSQSYIETFLSDIIDLEMFRCNYNELHELYRKEGEWFSTAFCEEGSKITFGYRTYSRLNTVYVQFESNVVTVWYTALSEKPPEYSQVVDNFLSLGWELLEYKETEWDTKVPVQEYEEKSLATIRSRKSLSILGVYFFAKYYYDMEGNSYHSSFGVGKNTHQIKILLERRPELRQEINEIISCQKKKIECTFIPEDAPQDKKRKEEVLHVLDEISKY